MNGSVVLNTTIQIETNDRNVRVDGDLRQNLLAINVAVTTNTSSSSPLLSVNGTAYLDGALLLDWKANSTNRNITILLLEANKINGSFTDIQVTSVNGEACATQSIQYNKLSILLRPSCKKRKGLSIVVIVVPVVCLVVVIALSIAIVLFIRRESCPMLWRSSTNQRNSARSLVKQYST